MVRGGPKSTAFSILDASHNTDFATHKVSRNQAITLNNLLKPRL